MCNMVCNNTLSMPAQPRFFPGIMSSSRRALILMHTCIHTLLHTCMRCSTLSPASGTGQRLYAYRRAYHVPRLSWARGGIRHCGRFTSTNASCHTIMAHNKNTTNEAWPTMPLITQLNTRATRKPRSEAADSRSGAEYYLDERLGRIRRS